MRNDFTLYFRKVPSGKRVYYYYAYDDDGERLGPWTTGQFTKTAARNYCNAQIRKGVLVPGIKGMTTFAVYAAEFWNWEKSEYLKDRRKRRKLTQGYADKCQKVADFTLIPYFGTMRLDRITGEVIDKWLDHMIAEKKENSTINGYFGTLMTMMKWAAKKRYILRDPFLDVQRLMNDRKEKQLITLEEFKTMFVDDWKTVWNNDVVLYTANKLAALTGMRVSEILGLKGVDVFDDHIFVALQYDHKCGDRDTKTKTKDNIPLTAELVKDLRKLIKINGGGYLFSLTGGDKPVTVRHIYNGLIRALKNMGLSKEAIKERGLNVHAWRHFCNTEMLKDGIPVKKVQAVTRHKSEPMTDRYTHFNPLEFTEVTNFQAELLKKKPKKPDNVANERLPLTLVKMPDNKKTERIVKAS
ncbi:MAG: tyrosine-type recombinase/integrase [Treponema sp.]|jgi:integrase|nr:tyrosine-type recombinase/integrase [Treponema sp.]